MSKTLCWWWTYKTERDEMWTYCSTTKKGTCEMWCSAISVHNQSSERMEVVVCDLAGLSWCHQRSEHGGDWDSNEMGWHRDSCLQAGGGERGEGEMRGLWAGREKNHMLAGEELALWWPCRQLSLSWKEEKIELYCLWVTSTNRKEDVYICECKQECTLGTFIKQTENL